MHRCGAPCAPGPFAADDAGVPNRARTRPTPPTRPETPEATEARAAAHDAGLRYTSDASPGLSRHRAGRGFTYREPDGRRVDDRETLRRIKALAIPPAWTDVWICRWPNGHLQASGRDARGRKQYRYHERWRTRRETDKFDRMLAFAAALPAIRARCDEDLGKRGLPREKVLAAVVRLLELTLIRVGNDEYARLNRSFGLTTLRGRHASVEGTEIHFRFRGKAGQTHDVDLRDRRLAAVVRRCQELPGQELFQYVDETGETRDIASEDVNDYLREASGGDFTAKDFRTWAGTVLAYRALRALQPGDDERDARRNVVEAIRQTAGALRNTPAVARRSYVHPAVLEAYMDGGIAGALVEAAEEQVAPPAEATPEEEAEVMALLRQRLDADAGRVKARRARSARGKGSG
jgi:DNA topoisomerase-1